MPEIKLNQKPNLLRLFGYLSVIILNYVNQFRKRYNISFHKAVIAEFLIEIRGCKLLYSQTTIKQLL
ncbi:hypothetical protein OTSUT76_0563 [Orientia tsutsugamushi str. UT76]|uniref:Uncharacterized protein n=1 Tax=Orientia tsutsugamushi TaxID=784 RepID=A0A2U3RNG9_ORITS|nr:hypothetical protein OTSKARP_0754 [Orientia tsutsugamushi str. Karp]KJV95024.1 hypothetical protein OTSUT76_0563 [Orientia tsutsugamushi str. UT76]QES96295.1 hypothetical protein F0363_06605 [Orientia tsutsugamushi]SPR04322.1 Uncharacterised protein [Orientia tsutsugamushi]SPR14783.1 Uncharacterised protein [Orientia tsutsugamushi]